MEKFKSGRVKMGTVKGLDLVLEWLGLGSIGDG